jgi:hypothetical protein
VGDNADAGRGGAAVATYLAKRPFDNYRSSITDPDYFFGRQALLQKIQQYPLQVRILLGGRRTGKTSLLNAIRWQLLNSGQQIGNPYRVFPVLINLNQEQPQSLSALRHLIVIRSREAINEFQNYRLAKCRKSYRRLLQQISGAGVSIFGISLNFENPDTSAELSHEAFRQELLKIIRMLKKQNLSGLCLLIDGAEFIVKQNWSNDAWSYFRGLKDTDTALKSFLGLILSGYRNLKDYQQQVGSPLLNIAELEWLGALGQEATQKLIEQRMQADKIALSVVEIEFLMTWAGCHPYLTQQMLNMIFDDKKAQQDYSLDSTIVHLLRQHDRDFSGWWDESSKSYGFSPSEQTVYKALRQLRESHIKEIAHKADLSFGETADALEVLVGTGIVLRVSEENYRVGAKLFEEWLLREST